MADERKEFCDGLRALADWYEAHQDIAVPFAPCVNNAALDTKDEAANVIRALGSCEKLYGDTIVTIRKKFGSVSADFIFFRQEVCTLKVVGKREVPETVIEAREAVVIPAHTVDITEWECLPILKPADQPVAAETA